MILISFHSLQCKYNQLDSSTYPLIKVYKNSTQNLNDPHNPSFFHDSHFHEAIRLIEIELRIIQQEELQFYKPSECKEPDSKYKDKYIYNPRYPTLFFSGTPHAHGVSDNEAEAKIEGNVRIGVDGTLRWTFVSGVLDDSGNALWW